MSPPAVAPLAFALLAVAGAASSRDHSPNCYGFPEREFSPSNHVSVCDPDKGCLDDGLGVKTGTTAKNFILAERSTLKPVSLFSVLENTNKPVFIELASYT